MVLSRGMPLSTLSETATEIEGSDGSGRVYHY